MNSGGDLCGVEDTSRISVQLVPFGEYSPLAQG